MQVDRGAVADRGTGAVEVEEDGEAVEFVPPPSSSARPSTAGVV